jgi:hypothetical protein
LKRFEDKAALFVKDALAVLQLVQEAYRPDLATGDAGIAGILRHTHGTFNATGLSPGNMTRHTLDLGVVKTVHHYLVIRTKPSKLGTQGADRPTFGAAQHPPSEKNDYQQDSRSDNQSDLFHDPLPDELNCCFTSPFRPFGIATTKCLYIKAIQCHLQQTYFTKNDTAMENLARYIIRASFFQERMTDLDHEGEVIYRPI